MTRPLSTWEYFVCGGFGGIVTVLVGHPFDTVKVRLQTQPDIYKSTFDCFQKTVKNEGILGLYKGMTAPLAAIVPIFSTSFLGYGIGKRIFNVDHGRHRLLRIFAAGGFSGIFTTLVTAPGERVKCLLQIQQSSANKQYDGTIDCIKKLYKAGGIKNIYVGTVATLVRDVPGAAVYFLTYQKLVEAFSGPHQKPTIPVTLVAGGMAGVALWTCSMPADVVKSRLQTAPPGTYPGGLVDAFSQLVKKEGPTALYKGFLPVMMRAFPANAACFLGFEFMANVLRKLIPG